MSQVTALQAVIDGLAEELRRDPSVWVIGEDLHIGGVYGQYKGITKEFGPERIVSAPISEPMIVCAGLGGALVGLRPVVEMRLSDFALLTIDEIVNQMAKARFMFGGQAKVPVTVRLPQGMLQSSAAQHSQSMEALYAHVPGLVVVAPSTPADCKGLLKAAIRCDDPVIYIEPRALYGVAGEVPDEDYVTPIGKARIARKGRDLTVVSWSSMVAPAEKAVEACAQAGIDAELIDLRSIWPWDSEAVIESVKKTGRLLVVHEAVEVGGFGGEVVSTVTSKAFSALKQAPARLGSARAPAPFSPTLEAAIKITPAKIEKVIKEMFGK